MSDQKKTEGTPGQGTQPTVDEAAAASPRMKEIVIPAGTVTIEVGNPFGRRVAASLWVGEMKLTGEPQITEQRIRVQMDAPLGRDAVLVLIEMGGAVR